MYLLLLLTVIVSSTAENLKQGPFFTCVISSRANHRRTFPTIISFVNHGVPCHFRQIHFAIPLLLYLYELRQVKQLNE